MRLHRETRGVALVEFAIVMPVLLLVLIGILEFGRAYNAVATMQNASAEAARWAALHPAASEDDIAAAIRGRVVPLNGAAIEVEASYDDGSAYQPWPETGIPASTPARLVPIRVVVRYPWSAATLFIGSFFPDRSGATLIATATADALR